MKRTRNERLRTQKICSSNGQQHFNIDLFSESLSEQSRLHILLTYFSLEYKFDKAFAGRNFLTDGRSVFKKWSFPVLSLFHTGSISAAIIKFSNTSTSFKSFILHRYNFF